MAKKEIAIIAAISKNRALGKDNKLLYSLPNDMKRFKDLTTHHTVIMGRKTFDSLPNGPLPNRENIIISRNPDLYIPGAIVYSSIEDAIKNSKYNKVFIIGGGQIYKQALDKNLATTLYLTIVNDTVENADTFFPELDDTWNLVSNEVNKADNKHKYSYTYQLWKK